MLIPWNTGEVVEGEYEDVIRPGNAGPDQIITSAGQDVLGN